MVTHLSRLAWKEAFTQLTNRAVSPAEPGTTVMALAANLLGSTSWDVPMGWSSRPGHLEHPALVCGDGHPSLAIQSQPSPLAGGELAARPLHFISLSPVLTATP